MSIVAMNWALQQRLKSAHQQILLYVIADSADATGMTRHCDPDYMAARARMSRASVFRRIEDLEELGLLERSRSYSEKGHHIYEIRLQFGTVIDVALQGRKSLAGEDVDDESSTDTEIPKSQPATMVGDDHSLTEAEAKSHCCDDISPPISEDYPLPPKGGKGDPIESGVQDAPEPEHFAPAWALWPGHEVMRRDLALKSFLELSPHDQRLCRAAVPLYASTLAKLRRSSPMNFHIWIRNRGFEEFPGAQLAQDAPAPIAQRFVQGAELEALALAVHIAERRFVQTVEDRERGKGIWTRRAAQPDLVALARFNSVGQAGWETVDEGTPQYAAWRDRLAHWLGREVKGEKVFLEDYNPDIHGRPPLDPKFKLRKSKVAFRVPAPWPPRRDGSWPVDSDLEGNTA